VLRWIVPLLVVAAPAVASSPGLSVGSWWEKITVTMTGDGKTQGCRYETNLASAAAKDCKVVGGGVEAQSGPAKDQYATITFERRFSPGDLPPGDAAMQPGDKLLGRQVMALVIDGAGKVGGCKVVAESGDTGLTYGCEDAAAEHFESSAASAAAPQRQGFMTILVYGHTEHVV
jgi:hypothetical protein